ncbi:MAG: hypothetical protein D6753_10600 [Planctomycetota bacterium]|nr:MAG: hypothetical protein D6753_10600 [Planctomycetota bacterium]
MNRELGWSEERMQLGWSKRLCQTVLPPSWIGRYGALLLATIMMNGARVYAQGDELPPPAPEEVAAEIGADVEVFSRGPLHESYATAHTRDAIEFPIVKKKPPQPIEEIVPEYRPAGKNVLWVPGYWYYDDEQDDFLWISGLWRNAPPGRQWVPGYWAKVDQGYQWRPGMWVQAGGTVTFQPPPPASQERGPSSPRPSENHFYVPGYWQYQDGKYVWKPGFWTRHQRGWVWVPARYYRSGNNAVFVNGYWDYKLNQRGQLFAPVRFRNDVTAGSDFRFQPKVAWINGSPLLLHLFVRGDTAAYYYGDYYDERYRSRYRPWYEHAQTYGYADPLLSYYEWTGGGTFVENLRNWHKYFVEHPDFRPRSTLLEQLAFLRDNQGRKYVDQLLTTNLLSRLVQGAGQQGFVRVDDATAGSVRQIAETMRALTQQRLQLEQGASNLIGQALNLPQLPALPTFNATSGQVIPSDGGGIIPSIPGVRVPEGGIEIPDAGAPLPGGLEVPRLPIDPPGGLPF